MARLILRGETLLENESWYKTSSFEFMSPEFEPLSKPMSEYEHESVNPNWVSSPKLRTGNPVGSQPVSYPGSSQSWSNLPGQNTPTVESSPGPSEGGLDLLVELNMDQKNEQE